MMALVERVRTLDLSDVVAPTLVVYSPRDAVVDPTETERAFQELGAEPKALVALEGSDDPAQHVLGGAIVSPSTTDRLVDEIVAFLAPLVGTPDAADAPGAS